MKNIILMFLFILTGAMVSNAQTTYKTDANGVLVQQQVIHTEQQAIGNGQPTGEQFKATNGDLYPVYKSANGRLFIVRVAKSGNHYKQYLESAAK